MREWKRAVSIFRQKSEAAVNMDRSDVAGDLEESAENECSSEFVDRGQFE